MTNKQILMNLLNNPKNDDDDDELEMMLGINDEPYHSSDIHYIQKFNKEVK